MSTALTDFRRNKRGETRKPTDSVSVLGVARTTPKLYCEQIRYYLIEKSAPLLDFREDGRGETQKLTDSVSVPGVARDNTQALLQ